ncbi:MAG: polysaccharide deacetylase family protein [Myxococcales bacterium]|nr:polysaccharide deacetylase family protein [Myxococcales bacterium]
MRLSLLSLLAVGSLSALGIACSAAPAEDGDGSEDALETTNIGARHFGLEEGELVLTLDDGPGPRTKELVDFLVANQVPAIFFQVGKNSERDPASSAYIAANSARVPGGLIVANHSNTHTDPLPKQGVSGSINEIMTADRHLLPHIKASQSQFASPIKFFRPPYGAFTALGASNIQQVNSAGGNGYVGPVFWEIGGELKGGFSADWACWGRNGVSVDVCANGYVAEAQARKKGIVLFHDVHAKTIDMLTGKGTVSLIKRLLETPVDPRNPAGKKFKFVSLRKNDAAVQDFARHEEQQQVAGAQINASADVDDDGDVSVTFDVAPVGAAKGVVSFDGPPTSAQVAAATGRGGTVVNKDLGPGQHVVYVSAIGADGKVQSERRFNLIVPSVLDADNDEGDACSNYANLTKVRSDGRTAGRPFKVFIKQENCGGKTANDGRAPYVAMPGECYRYNGTAKVAANADGRTAAVKAVGGDEWSVEYDLGFASDPNDKSKLSLIIESGKGHIVTGKRSFKGTRPAVNFHETSVDCENGVWRGVLGTEEFLFRSPIQGEPEFEDR